MKSLETITLIATARFGLEALVKREVEALGFTDLRVSDGRVEFEAAVEDIPRLNIWLRFAGRLLLKMGE
ncbi:MAG: class I SAM-dependent RNA methyltransferase, partial [Candidatus Promineifilaceae bacterium]